MRSKTRSFFSRELLSLSVPLFFIAVAGVLMVRASDPLRWSRWSFGDAQTMMAVSNWKHEGFRATNFLWIPQGWSNVSPLFDEPAMQHHAHGIGLNEVTGRGTPKRVYTHYPSWYAVPYGIMAKLGIDGKTYFQWVAILLSVLAAYLFYRYCRTLKDSDLFCVSALVLYVLSDGFLNYSDSLANMPMDEVFRMTFLIAWTRYQQTREKKYFRGAMAAHFFGSVVSLDSVLFNFVYGTITELFLQKKNRRLASLSCFIVVPLLAFGIHFLQNVGYLGLEGAAADWFSTFVTRATPRGASLAQYLDHLWNGILSLVMRTFNAKGGWIVGFGILGILVLKRLKEHRLLVQLVALFLAGLAYAIVFPGRQVLGYQTRQLLPFQVVLFSSLLVFIPAYFARAGGWKQKLVAGLGVAVLVSVVWNGFFKFLKNNLDLPPRLIFDAPSGYFHQKLNAKFPGDKVIFAMGATCHTPMHDSFMGGPPQVNPVFEHFAGGPVLCFTDTNMLRVDLEYLWKHKRAPFTPLVMTKESDLGALRAELERIPNSSLETVLQTRAFGTAFKVGFREGED